MASYGRYPVVGSIHSTVLRSCLPYFSQIATYSTRLQKCLKAIGLPAKPKKPYSSFVAFAQQMRVKLLAEDPTTTMMAQMKSIGALWAGMDSTQRQPYKDDYVKRVAEYQLKLKEYEASITEEQKLKIQKCLEQDNETTQITHIKQKLNSLGRPKRPGNSFIQFIVDQKNAGGNNSRESYVTLWKNLSAEEKDKYIIRAAADAKEYAKKLKEWEKQMVEKGYENFLEITKKSKRKSVNKNGTEETDGMIWEGDQDTSDRQMVKDDRSTLNKAKLPENSRPSDVTTLKSRKENTTRQNLCTSTNAEITEFSTEERASAIKKNSMFKRFVTNPVFVLSTNYKYTITGMCTFIILSIYTWHICF